MSVYAGLSLKEVYEHRCKYIGIPVNSALAKQLPEDPDKFDTLRRLDLSANFIGPKGVMALIEVVRCCRRLHCLDLTRQQITQQVLEPLCAVLRTHPTVQRVNLSGNPLTISAGPTLLAVLKHNPNITYLNVDKTHIKEAMTFAIGRQTDENRVAREHCTAAAAAAPATQSSQRVTDGLVSGDGADDGEQGEPLSDRRVSEAEVRIVLAQLPYTVDKSVFDVDPLPVLQKWLRAKRCRFFDMQFPSVDALSAGAEGSAAKKGSTAGVVPAVHRVATLEYSIFSWMRLSELYPTGDLFLPNASADDAMVLPGEVPAGFEWIFTCVNATGAGPPRAAPATAPPTATPTIASLRRMVTAGEKVGGESTGLYAVRLFLDGEWRYVVVDDFLPVTDLGQPVFTKPIAASADPGSAVAFWPCILEKAMAKMYGGYQHLDSATELRKRRGATPVPPRCARTLADLTGGVGLVRSLSTVAEEHHASQVEATSWDTLMEVLDVAARETPETVGTTRAVAVSKTADEYLTASGRSADELRFVGVQLNHAAYQVLQVRQVNGFSLVQLLNPFTDVLWRGEWCERSLTWRQNPDISHELRGDGGSLPGPAVPKKDAQEPFWMSFADFRNYFAEIHLCRIFPAEQVDAEASDDEDLGSEYTGNDSLITAQRQRGVSGPASPWRERLLRGVWSHEVEGGCLGHCEGWYRNPHFRLIVYERGTVFVQLFTGDYRYVKTAQVASGGGVSLVNGGASSPSPSASSSSSPLVAHGESIALHVLRAPRYPIRAEEPAPGAAVTQSTCLVGTRYTNTDASTFEGIFEPCDESMPFWIVPSLACKENKEEGTRTAKPPSDIPFFVRIFSNAPFQLSLERFGNHWEERVVDAAVERGGEFMYGEDNPQITVHVASPATLADIVSDCDGGSAKSEAATNGRPKCSSAAGAAESANDATGTILVKMTATAQAADTKVIPMSKLIITDGETDSTTRAGARLYGPIEPDEVLAESAMAAPGWRYAQLTDCVGHGDRFNLVGFVHPAGLRADLRFTVWSSLRLAQVTPLANWPTEELTVTWDKQHGSGAFDEASGNPQIEVYPLAPESRVVVRMRMTPGSFGPQVPTILVTLVSNDGRCGEGLLGRIPGRRILARSDYIHGEWAQCDFEAGAEGMSSLLIVPFLQPARTHGTCVISVSSVGGPFAIREVTPRPM